MHALDNQMHFTISGSSVLLVFWFFLILSSKGYIEKTIAKVTAKTTKRPNQN